MADMIRLCRLYYSAPLALTYTLTVYYAAGGRMVGRWPGTIASTFGLFLVICAGYVLNDVFDAGVDRLKTPRRPVASGRVKRRTATILGAALMAAGLAVAALARVQFLISVLVVAGGLILYDTFSKQLGVAKELVVGALVTSIYPLALAQAGGATGPRAWSLAVFPAWMFLTSFGYEVLKDIRDAPGDQQVQSRPGPLQRNRRRWRAIASWAIVLGAAALAGPAFAGCKWLYAVIASAAVAAAVISTVLSVPRAIGLVYVECVLVGVAATADPLLLGF